MQTQIKQAAVQLFNEAGSGFTLDQLQSCTGISRATLYRRIGSKEALLIEMSAEGLIELDSQADIDSRIYSATRSVVAEYGFINCTMEQIANEANLGVATLYRHFNDKENLFRCFIAQLGPALGFKSILQDEEDDLEEGLRQIIDMALRFLHDNHDLVKILYSWQNAERSYLDHIREGSTTNFTELSRYLARQQKRGKLRQDVSATDQAIALNALLMQYSVYAPIYQNRPLNIIEDGKAILKLFLQGAKNEA